MKPLNRLSLMVSALCLSTSLLGGTFGIWQNLVLQKPYGPWLVQFDQEAISNHRGKHYFSEYQDIGCWYTGITKWFGVGAFYRYLMAEDTSKQWIGEHAPHIDTYLLAHRNHLLFQYRARLQYLSTPTKEWFFRNQFLISYNTRYIEIFGSVEPFYDITTNQLSENYLIAGVGKQIGKHFNGKLYYLNLQEPHSKAERVGHFLGILFVLSF